MKFAVFIAGKYNAQSNLKVTEADRILLFLLLLFFEQDHQTALCWSELRNQSFQADSSNCF